MTSITKFVFNTYDIFCKILTPYIISCIISIYFYSKIKKVKSYLYKKAHYSKIADKVKQGDLIFFSNYRYDFITRFFGHPVFSHLGIVIEIDNQKYAYELLQQEKNITPNIIHKNICIIPLKKRIATYHGNVFIAPLKQQLSPYQIEIFNKYIQKAKYTYTPRWKSTVNILTNRSFKNERFCSEFTAELLYYIGVTNIPIQHNKLNVHNEIVKLTDPENIYSMYNKPVHIINDDDLIESLNDNN